MIVILYNCYFVHVQYMCKNCAQVHEF